MDFESDYLDLFDLLNTLSKKIASGQYDQSDRDKLSELTKKNSYPDLLAELSESFGMMMVNAAARASERKQIIEDLKKTKVRLEDYLRSLEHKLSKKTEELQKKNAQLEEEIQKHQKLEELKAVFETIGGACHDLNQPLQSISGNVELLMLKITADQPHYTKIKAIRDQVDRLVVTADKLMGIARDGTKT